MRTRLSVRWRLLLAFLGISALAVLAAGAGGYAFRQVAGVLDRIIEQRVPTAVAALRLSRQAERIVAAAPALLTARSQAQHQEVSAAVTAEVGRLERLLGEVKGSTIDASRLAAIETAVEGLRRNLEALEALEARRLSVAARKDDLVQRLGDAMTTAQRFVAPGILVMDAKIAAWRQANFSPPPAGADPQAVTGIAEAIAANMPMQKAQLEITTVNDGLLKTASAASPTELQVMVFPLKRSLAALRAMTPDLPQAVAARLARPFDQLGGLIEGPESIPEARGQELALVAEGERLLAENATLSGRLTTAVDALVGAADRDIRTAGGEALAVQRFGGGVLLGVVALSLLSSLLIVWLYVDRNLVARLTALSESMLAIAGGNLRAALPAGGGDEIGRMAEALATFRDTAVEVEENNLREIAQAQQRLVDAIESITEGFAFYDADDRLVLCNTQYRDLLHPNDAAALRPGTPFATIIRDAVGKGLIVEAEEDPEAYIHERLEHHRNPGPPRLQRRRDGRWLLISERKIAGGGTVAVYSDLTELKEKEQRVAFASRQILDSLRYASRIQSAVLPPRDALAAVAGDHFLLWQPRDIVGGDFFWVRHGQGGDLIMLGDCTGHGVPGAFMTLIVTGLLDRVARDLPGESPGRLLSGLHRELQGLLGQHRGAGETDDGLEAGLCFLSRAERKVVFAGARFSLWRARGGAAEEIKGESLGVGFRRVPADTAFGELTLDLAEDDKLYLVTDGLTDQIGGTRRRSFGKRRLARFIAGYHGRPMAEQEAALSRLFAQYQGREVRRDDVTVLGFAPLRS